MQPLEQHEALVLHLDPCLRLKLPADALADALDRIVGHAHHVELVDHDRAARQLRGDDLTVDAPHVHRHDLDVLLVAKVLEVGQKLYLASRLEEIEDRVLLDVGQHAAVLTDDLQLVDAQHPGHLVHNGLLCACRVVIEHVPDGLVVDANLSRDLSERALHAALLYVGHQATGHLPLAVHRGQ